MTKPLRILLVVEPGIDGVFRHVEGLTHYLLDQGLEVHLAYSDKRGSPELLRLLELVQQKGGSCLNLRVGNSPHLHDLPALLSLHAFAKKVRPDVIHGHSSKAGVLSRALYFLGVRADYFYTPHAYYGLSFRPDISTKFYNWIEHILGKVGTTINISEDERLFALNKLKIAAARCVAIPNPVDPQTFKPPTNAVKFKLRRRFNIPENAIVIGSMGRLSFQKDPASLYQAFAMAREKGLDIYLIHVGRGELNEEMETLARTLQIDNRLIRFPYFSNPIEFYSVVDAVILTSRYEAGWPLVLLEAMACDMPIISGKGPGTSTISHSGLSHCWTAVVGDVPGFAQAIEAWFEDRKLARPSNHRVVALERFSPDICFGALLDRYELGKGLSRTRKTDSSINAKPRGLNIALAHHWLVGMRGGEKVLEQICRVIPGAPIYTLVAQPERLSPTLRSHPIHTSWLQRLPGGTKQYKKLLPLFPQAISSLHVKGPIDLVVSSDASVIKGLSYPPGVPHICYCHSPPRYLWDLQKDYSDSSEVGGPIGRAFFTSVVPYIREFDLQAAKRVTHFIANSSFVRDRIRSCYGREAEVIHPPVYLEEFEISTDKPDDFYLIVSQLVPYKRIDLAVTAFNRLKRKLIIIGEGSERARLERNAGPHITFLGSQPQVILRDHYRRCRALIFPGIEDFGITPLEAQASGRPVVAFRAGGVIETILENSTGLFFNEQSAESLAEAVELFETREKEFNPAECRKNATRFGEDQFLINFSAYLAKHSFLPSSR